MNTKKLLPLALVLAGASCTPTPSDQVRIALPSAVQALRAEDAAALVATLEIPGLLAETALVISADRTEATGRFEVNGAGAHDFVLKLRFAPPERDGANSGGALLGELRGTIDIVPNTDNALEPTAPFDTCGAVAPAPCAPLFDLNRNGLSNLEDLVEELDPFPAAPFVDVAPDDLPFPSGIRLGAFARQVIVVENVTARPVRVSATLVDAPGVTLSLYETTFNPANSAQRALDLGELQPFQEVLVAVSFAPVNAFLTVGDIFVEATDDVGGVGVAGATGIRQAQRIRILANADGELQPPPPDFAPAPVSAEADLAGFPPADVETFASTALFNGLPVTSVTLPEASVSGVPFTGRTITATFDDGSGTGTGAEASVPADAAFLVEVPAGHKLSVSLNGLESDIDLAFFLLADDGSDDIVAGDAARNRKVGKAGVSPEALEHRNGTAANQRALLVLGRVEFVAPGAGLGIEGGLALDVPAPFALSAHATSAPEFTRPPSPLGGPLEGGNRVTLFGRGFQLGAAVTFADGIALDCALTDGADEDVLECAAPAGSLLVGKNPATVVVANPGRDDGGDGQAATLPEGYAYEPPAPRLDAILPNVAPRTGNSAFVSLEGAFFSLRNGEPEVTFGAVVVPAEDVELVNSTLLRVVPPDQSVAGIVSVSVRNKLDPQPGDPVDLVRFSLPSNVRNFTYVDPTLPAPSLTSVNPTTVSIDGGDVITLTGTGFQAGATVLVDGETCDDVEVASATEASCEVPARDAPGLVDVEIVNPDGQRAALPDGVTFEIIIPDPAIAGVFPDQASVDGGTFIVIEGQGFRAGVVVEFIDAADVAIQSLNVNRVSTTTLLAATPAVEQGGDYTLRVRNINGQSADYSGVFRFLEPEGPAPRIDLISPAFVDQLAPGEVTLRGADFRSPAVLVGTENVALTEVDVDGAEDVVRFLPPAQPAPGPQVVRLINNDGQSDTAVLNYETTLGAAPVIDSVSPGVAGAADQITLNGRNFDADGAGALSPGATLAVGGQQVTPSAASAASLTLTVPNLDALVVDGAVVAIELTNSDGQSTSASFVYDEDGGGLVPVVTSVSPSAASVGQSVAVSGSGFDVQLIQVGAVAVPPSSANATSATFTVPAGAAASLPATVLVRVLNVGGAAATANLTILAQAGPGPRVDSIAPSEGPPTGGTVVTLSGANFVAAGGVLRVGGAVVTPSSVSAGSVVFTTPPAAGGADGVASVSWTNADGQSASASFRYETPAVGNTTPAVGFLSPTQVHALVPGDTITLVGANLAAVSAASIARVTGAGTFTASIVTQTDVSVTISLEQALPDSVDIGSAFVVRLTHPGGTVTSPPFEAKKPRVTLTLEQGFDQLVFIGELFNPTRLDGVGVLDNGFGSAVAVDVLSASETFLAVRIASAPVPGSLYELALDYASPEGGIVNVVAGGAAFQAPSLGAAAPNIFLPAGSNLQDVLTFVNVPGGSNPQFGTPTTFSLLDQNGAVVAGGTWFFESFEEAHLTFDATPLLPVGNYGVRLATDVSPALAEQTGAFFLEQRQLFALFPQPVLTGVPADGDGLFLAGDLVVAQNVATGDVRTLGVAQGGAVRTGAPGIGAGGGGNCFSNEDCLAQDQCVFKGPPPGFCVPQFCKSDFECDPGEFCDQGQCAFDPDGGPGQGGDVDGFFVGLDTSALFAGNWRVCVVGPADAAGCAPTVSFLQVVVEASTCAAPRSVGAGDVAVVPLDGFIPGDHTCFDSGLRRGHVLRLTTAQPLFVQARAAANRTADLDFVVGRSLCGSAAGGPFLDACFQQHDQLNQSFLSPGTYELFVYDKDPASPGDVVATVQFTASDGAVCAVADGDGDGATVCAFDCRDDDPAASLAGNDDDGCNGVDNDCDGRLDDLAGVCPVGGQVGVCADGARVCAGAVEQCQQTTFPGQRPERCFNGADDDCNDQVDEPGCITIPESSVSRFGAAGCVVGADHNGATGDDRGGIAAADDFVFINGDIQAARYDAANMGGLLALPGRQDSLFSNLADGTFYAFFSDALGRTFDENIDGSFTVNSFVPLNPATGQADLAAPRITLSPPLIVNERCCDNGIFAGEDMVIIANHRTDGFADTLAWNVVDLTTGNVETLAETPRLPQGGCETWAIWGVAEKPRPGQFSVAFVSNSQRIARFEFPSKRLSIIDTFSSLSDMCSIAVVPTLQRWFWHHEGGSQFGGSSETAGSCPAVLCGDGACEPANGEHNTSCPIDCNAACGNGICELGGETFDACPGDCAVSCGNGLCEPGLGESATACPGDCFRNGAIGFAGDGFCTQDEPVTFPGDCAAGAACGNGVCESLLDESAITCASDCAAPPTTSDLTADWSDTANRNGPWSLRAGNVLVPTNVVDWTGFSGQRAWANAASGNGSVPAFMQAIDPALGDVVPGDIVVHSQDDSSGAGFGTARVVWTAPASGLYDISGALWMTRALGRSNNWTLRVNGVTFASGSLFDGDLFDRANPAAFAGFLTPGRSLNSVPIAAGQTVELQIVRTSIAGDLVGVRFTVTQGGGT